MTIIKSPVSVCIIVRHDPHLAATVASVRPFVREVCIFCDSPDDVEAAEAERLADKFERAFDLNGPDGRLADWSKARNRAHAMATQPWVMTLDSDDILENGEALRALLNEYDDPDTGPVRITLPYDYSFDPYSLRCTRRQPRVRLVKCRDMFLWKKAVHEGWFARDGVRVHDVYDQRVTVRHTKRDWAAAAKRATDIITSEAGPSGVAIEDPRDRYDYGMMLAQNGDVDAAVRELTRYVAESGRDDEKAQACLKLAWLTGHIGDLVTPLKWAEKAHRHAPTAFEPLFKLGQIYELMARMAGNKDAARLSIVYCKDAIASRRDWPSLVPYSPLDRDVSVYETWHEAAKTLGDEDCAIDALVAGLEQSRREPRLALTCLTYCGDPGPHDGGKDIVFVLGNTPNQWNPVSVEETGIGGSETATIHMARGLAANGHRVRVYVDCGREGLYDGVEYLFPWRLNEEQAECDLLIAWRSARFLEAVPAKVKWLWVHDEVIFRPTAYLVSLADRVLALTEWHKRHLLHSHANVGLKPGRVSVTRNGIDVTRFDKRPPRNPHRAIYSSSPDRGLETLLAVWPRIRREVPDAELHVYYGDAALAAEDPTRAARIRADVEDLRACGVSYFGRVNQHVLAEAMLGAGVYAYPTAFRESSCMSLMEAQAAGLFIVTSRYAALPETVGEHGILLDGDPATDKYRDKFARDVASSMRICDKAAAPSLVARQIMMDEARKRFPWSDVVEQWQSMIDESFAELEAAQ